MSDLVVERRIAAPPDAVYAYLTDAALWARWQGERAELEAAPGGAFSMHVRDGPTARGELVALEPGRRVVLTWGWDGHPTVPPGSTTVEIELLADGDATLVRLTHRGLPDGEVPAHRDGWEHYLPRLATAAAGGDPGPDRMPG